MAHLQAYSAFSRSYLHKANVHKLLAGSLSFLSSGGHLLIKLHSTAAGSAPP